MKCEDALLLISGRLDGENTPEEEQLLQTHLEECEACRGLLQTLAELDHGIADLSEEAPADLCEKVIAAIAAPKKRQKWWPALAAAAAVALVIGLGSGYLPTMQSEEAAVPMAARTAVVEYAEPAANFHEISGRILAEIRRAYVVETNELLPEMENCSCEELEDGSLLYQLPSAEAALEMAEKYELDVFWHEQAEEAYVLLLKKEE